jgi:ABC-2 type transport system ATP-binding protein
MNGLTADGLGARFGRHWAVRGATFAVPAGRVAALVGPNGAGKSTLLSMLAGTRRPTAGTVSSGTVRMVGQTKPVYGNFTASQMLQFGRRTNEVWDHQTATAWLDAFAIPANRRCDRLSGGQRTQVALALGVGARPDVLLLDEPLAELDPVARVQVVGRLLSLVADHGTALILSTHVIPDLHGVADTLLVMMGGRLVLTGDVDEVLTDHHYLEGQPSLPVPGGLEVVRTRQDSRRSRLLVRGDLPGLLHPSWAATPAVLEDLILDYLQADQPAGNASSDTAERRAS